MWRERCSRVIACRVRSCSEELFRILRSAFQLCGGIVFLIREARAQCVPLRRRSSLRVHICLRAILLSSWRVAHALCPLLDTQNLFSIVYCRCSVVFAPRLFKLTWTCWKEFVSTQIFRRAALDPSCLIDALVRARFRSRKRLCIVSARLEVLFQ